jgi:hypothetical protein
LIDTEKKQASSVNAAVGNAGSVLQWTRSALLILCVTLFSGLPAAAARQQDVSKGGVGAAGANFAIADFDGDSLPDLAIVRPGLAMASRTDYWIHFNFSLGSQWSFEVSAPTGGLQIASRDVNGDSFLDLIVSTRIANEPVAVLLNDGRGNFRLADVGAFGAGIWGAQREWRSSAVNWHENEVAIASAGWAAATCDAGVGAELWPTTEKVPTSPEKTGCVVVPHEDRGRAPPAA